MYKLFLAHGGDWVESQRSFERPEDVLKAQSEIVAAALANGWNVGTRIERVVEPAAATASAEPTRFFPRPAESSRSTER